MSEKRSEHNIGRFFFVASAALLFALFFVELFFFAWCRSQCRWIGYSISDAMSEQKVLAARRESLQANVAHLTAPRRIKRIGAERLGLVQPSLNQVVVVNNDKRSGS